MRSTFALLFYINRSKIKADGTTAVMCRITIDGKSTALATGIYCNLDDWNAKKQEIAVTRDNNRLANYSHRMENLYYTTLKEQGVVSAELLKNQITRQVIVPTTLLQMGEQERERLRVRSEVIKSNSTYRSSGYYQNYLRQFLATMGKEDIAFTDITEEFGRNYKAFLIKNKSFGPSQTNLCMCWLNRLVYLAVDNEILRANPLEEIEYERKPEPKRLHITQAEFQKILSNPMPDAHSELTRRAFIFSTLTGLAYADIQALHPHHIGMTADGRRYIRINRKKTKVEAFIPLHPIAEQILDLYNTTDDNKPVFPLPNRDAIWFDIHEIGFGIGREENLSYHQARHSFGTFLINAGICTESIAKMMGHASIRSTRTYARLSEKKIGADMDALVKRREEEGLSKNEIAKQPVGFCRTFKRRRKTKAVDDVKVILDDSDGVL